MNNVALVESSDHDASSFNGFLERLSAFLYFLPLLYTTDAFLESQRPSSESSRRILQPCEPAHGMMVSDDIESLSKEIWTKLSYSSYGRKAFSFGSGIVFFSFRQST